MVSPNELFRLFAKKIAFLSGTAGAFMVALTVIFTWAITGPIFQFSNTWQLAINTTTTIVTFLMVFLIQNTQNRDSKALHLKIDELLRSTKTARNSLVNIEEDSDETLELLQEEFKEVQEKYIRALAKRQAKKTTTQATKATTASKKK